jgi:(1->4)-alpha-D-glucan 1-alpha-D-glucosylmutase
LNFPLSPAPLATYRLQLNAGFSFSHVIDNLPYIASLGISHLYLSPIWQARPGSPHGYDICDASVINEELGGENGYLELSSQCAKYGIGIILDFVSNHMATDTLRNPAWRDTLRNGPSSPYADYFDIDWEPVKPELRSKVLLPILGKQYGEVLGAGELQIAYSGGEFRLRYWEHDLPLNPREWRQFIRYRLDEFCASGSATEEDLKELQSILFQLDHVPAYWEGSPEARENRLRELAVAQQRLVRLLETSAAVKQHIETNLAIFNGRPGDESSFDLLHDVLERQPYRLSYWRTALHEINYRRFFDINELAGLRMESPQVFADTHAKALSLLRAGHAQGLRIDHIDGLYDPTAYLAQLRAELAQDVPAAYIVVEKILSPAEPLAGSWPIDGTTGYEFLNELNHLYVHPQNFAVLLRIYQRFIQRSVHFEQVTYLSKQQIISTSLASELNVLAHELNRISEQNRKYRDFTLDSLQEALREVAAFFPVYRTYIRSTGEMHAFDVEAVNLAIRRAVEHNPALEASIFDFLRECLCPSPRPDDKPGEYERRLRFALKFQQYSGPVQAKGIEDTAFYRYCPLVSLNEVGGEPHRISNALERFHLSNQTRQRRHPLSMIATSTHDTKRSEDARARINVLSEIPGLWRQKLNEWSRLTASAKTGRSRRALPDRNDEYLYYQSLLAIWPEEAETASEDLISRMKAYMSKAIKEAKVHTSWINPSNHYDRAMERFIHQTLAGKTSARFLPSFVPFAKEIAKFGRRNSLSQLALKLAAPGVPDIYQGTEFLDFSLVDPDNRRPVDFAARQHWLDQYGNLSAAAVPENYQKAAMLRAGLQLRRSTPVLFQMGEYLPLRAEGPHSEHVVSFARILGEEAVVVIALRWFALLGDADLANTQILLPESLARRTARNLFTGARQSAQQALQGCLEELPAALLHFDRNSDTL